MKPWIYPFGLAALVGAAVVATSMVGVAPLPPDAVRESATRVSVVCPGFRSPTTNVQIAATSADQKVRTAKLSKPQKVTESSGLALVNNPGEPVRVSVPRSEMFGATTVASAAAGPGRGLAATSCLAPESEFWFTGVDVTQAAQSDLVLVNLDSTDAVVDLVAYGAGGRLSAPRGLTVTGGKSYTLSLGVIARQSQPITVKVSTSQGRVAAFIRQLSWQKTRPNGADWVPAGLGPANDVVVPGVPAGKGRRTLVVTNPSDWTADVQVDVLGTSGLSQVADATRVQVPPGVTMAFDLATGLAGQSAGLRLHSNYPITAGVMVDNGLDVNKLDNAVIGSTPAMPDDAVWPLWWGKAATANLQLVNPGTDPIAATVSFTSDGRGQPKTVQVTVPPTAAALVPLPKAAVTTIRIQTASSVLHGSVVATQTLGKVSGLAVIDLIADETREQRAQVFFNPHLG